MAALRFPHLAFLLFSLLTLPSCSDGDDSGDDSGDGGETGQLGGAANSGGGQSGSPGSGGRDGSGGGPAEVRGYESALDLSGAAASTRLSARPLGTTDSTQGYYEYLPSGYTTEVAWPLIVALHGLGENGNGTSEDDLRKVLRNGPLRLVNDDSWPIERPFVVLAPQHAGGGCPGAAQIDTFLEFAVEEYSIALDQIYLTGVSCGAIGAWNYVAQHGAKHIAAMVPISGDGRSAWQLAGCDLAQVGIWAFHGDPDGIVATVGTTSPIENLADCPSPPALETKMTIYPGAGHDAWTRTFDLSAGHDIYTWMLGFVRESAP